MPVVIPDGFGQVVLTMVHRDTLKAAVNTFGVELPDPLPGDIADTLVINWGGNCMSNISSAYRFTNLKIRDAVGVLREATADRTGDDVGDPIPPQVSFLVKKVSASPGRHNRGRVYVPGVNEPMVDGNGTLGTEIFTNLQEGMDEWHFNLTDKGLIPTILHSTVGLAPTPVTSFQLEHVIATQRRRLKR